MRKSNLTSSAPFQSTNPFQFCLRKFTFFSIILSKLHIWGLVGPLRVKYDITQGLNQNFAVQDSIFFINSFQLGPTNEMMTLGTLPK
jgi:hypothetical protein